MLDFTVSPLDPHLPDKGDIPSKTLPRFFTSLSESGLTEMTFNLTSPRESVGAEEISVESDVKLSMRYDSGEIVLSGILYLTWTTEMKVDSMDLTILHWTTRGRSTGDRRVRLPGEKYEGVRCEC